MGHVVRLTGARAQVEKPRRAIDRGRSTSMLARVTRQVDAREAHVARDHSPLPSRRVARAAHPPARAPHARARVSRSRPPPPPPGPDGVFRVVARARRARGASPRASAARRPARRLGTASRPSRGPRGVQRAGFRRAGSRGRAEEEAPTPAASQAQRRARSLGSPSRRRAPSRWRRRECERASSERGRARARRRRRALRALHGHHRRRRRDRSAVVPRARRGGGGDGDGRRRRPPLPVLERSVGGLRALHGHRRRVRLRSLRLRILRVGSLPRSPHPPRSRPRTATRTSRSCTTPRASPRSRA